jgi:tRNA(Ile)-lysidine synthase
VRAKQTKLHEQVMETIHRRHMLQAGDRVGVAVSGGADSVGLLRLLEDLRGKLGITLVVLHFNHLLRGADSDADEEFAAALARERKLEFIADREEVAARSRENHWNLEDGARKLRYAFFARVVEGESVSRVAVAHTADDQAETVLGRLIRGTGLEGLAGIYPVNGSVVRPLLDIRRSALRGYLAKIGQFWREDATNLDTRRMRSRIRHQLLPQLESNFSKAIVERLDKLAELARHEGVFWPALVEDCFRAHAIKGPQGFSIRISDLLIPLDLPHAGTALPALSAAEAQTALTQRLVRRLMDELFEGFTGNRHELSARHVQQVIRLARESSSGRAIQLPGGVTVEKSFDRLNFSRYKLPARQRKGRGIRAAATSYEYAVAVPAQGSAAINVPEIGRRFRLKLIDWPSLASDTKRVPEGPEMTKALDADRLSGSLILRNWRPGDAYRPRGRRQELKLKRLFLTQRIAASERSRWPVLVSAGKLVWVRGMPPAEEFAAGKDTRTVLLIDEESC